MEDNYKHPADEKKVRFRPNIISSRNENIVWIVLITVLSFALSATLLFVSSGILENVSLLTAFCVVLVIIFIGIIFDIIGIAVTAADEIPFHAMASRKYYGARRSIRLIRNANKVSSFCNDVVGDICGVISGTASGLIIVGISQKNGIEETTLLGMLMTGLVAALTVGGKAIGKTFAIKNSNYIVYKVSVIIQFVIGRISFAKTKKTNRKSKER